jgi:putative ABC transport system permease protein
MLITYLKTAWRGIVRNKVYSGLNIFGLAVGMAVALLIGLWVQYQYSYDRFLPGYHQTYQVRYNYNNNGEIRTQSEVCIPLADALKNDVPEIAYTASAFGPDNYGAASDFLEVGDKRIYPVGFVGGGDILRIFGYPILKGSIDGLKEPNSIVLTESTVKALFGNADPIGKVVRRSGYDNLKVTAVLKDIPRNASLRFGFITSFPDFEKGWAHESVTNWNHALFKLFVALKPNVTYAQVEPKIRGLVQKYAPDTYKTFQQQVIMQPLPDWRLFTDYKNGKAVGGLIDYVRMFSIIGILVLLIACINFMNLSTARSEKRAKEVGIRKVVGSPRYALIIQFLLESLILTGLAFGICLLLVHLVLPAFNTMAHCDISIPYSNGWFWLIMLGYILLTGLLAGCRPAFYLSSFRPVKVLKGKINAGRSAIRSRKVLVVTQFTCSIALIVSTLIIYQQIQHARQRPRGYNPNHLVITEAQGVNYTPFKQEALSLGLISGMTACLSPATDVYSHNTIDNWPGRMPNEPMSLAMNALADTDYFRVLGIGLAEGRNFTGNISTDTTCVILNETAVRRMRLRNPVGQAISWATPNAPYNLRIVGVVHDALTNAPFAPPEPTMYIYQPGWAFTAMYRLAPGVSTQVALTRLGAIFHKYNPSSTFRYHFADENFQSLFDLENLVGKLAGIFAALTIFISCLGLFGLAAYTAEQRTKEIGIRKVLGASAAQVVVLLMRDFVWLVGISCLIATPLAFYFWERWLEGYYYRIHVGPGVFILSTVGALCITVITISFQSLKAAWMNPVESLRAE